MSKNLIWYLPMSVIITWKVRKIRAKIVLVTCRAMSSFVMCVSLEHWHWALTCLLTSSSADAFLLKCNCEFCALCVSYFVYFTVSEIYVSCMAMSWMARNGADSEEALQEEALSSKFFPKPCHLTHLCTWLITPPSCTFFLSSLLPT